ncbi:MAG: hypothetical protein CMH55_05470 [Myxococcales bacterium]|nr:hypothetical protein [Myxococcales bacterium]
MFRSGGPEMRPRGDHGFDRLLLAGIEGGHPLPGELAGSVRSLAGALRDGEVSIPLPSLEGVPLAEDPRLAWNPPITQGIERPLVVHSGRLYLGRYFEDMRRLALAIKRRRATEPEAQWQPPDGVFDGLSPGQAEALNLACRHAITFVTGGPGTGKTHVIQSLVDSMAPGHQALLLAPTGKAAGRLPVSERVQVRTIHKALGLYPGGRHGPKFHPDRPFDAELVVVDEVSMVGLTLLRQLVEAVGPKARLVLVGDKDQLQSVAAGSVLGPLLQRAASTSADAPKVVPVARLQTSFRFGGALAALAAAAADGDEAAFFSLLESGEPGVKWVDYADPSALRSSLRLGQGQVLCAHRHGPIGSEQLNGLIAAQADHGDRPIIIRRNDEELGLFNGDIGVLSGEEASFSGRTLPRSVLPFYESAFALTIHQSQGSEFDFIRVVLPSVDSPLLSRELLYTAMTRAREGLTLYGSRESLKTCLHRPSSSAPGLLDLLDELDGF